MAASTLQHSPAAPNDLAPNTGPKKDATVEVIAARGEVKETTGPSVPRTEIAGRPPTQQTLGSAKPCLAAAPKMESHTPLGLSALSVLSPPCNGPSAASYSVPPRPKPGRKPALDKPSEKRKAQNREAQRAFRERKVAHTEELRQELDQLKDSYDDVVKENGSLKRKLHEIQTAHKLVEEQSQRHEQLVSQLQNQVRKYHEEEIRWMSIEQKHLEAQQRLKMEYEQASQKRTTLRSPSHSTPQQLPGDMAFASIQQQSPLTPPQQSPVQGEASCGDCARTGYCKCVEDFTVDLSTVPPPSTSSSAVNAAAPSYDELEMDFTSQLPRHPPRPTAQDLGSHKPGCGFCEDSAGCLCQTDAVTDIAPPAPEPRRADPMQISSIVEPGTCLKCQEDPEQRRFCIEVSKSRQISLDLPDRSSNKRPRLDDGRPRTMTCNELFQASKHVVAESRRTGRTKPAEMESMFNSYAKTELIDSSKIEARPGMR